VATTAVLPLLSEKKKITRYPKLGAYPKYDYFTLLGFWTLAIVRYSKEHNVSKTQSVSVLR
jgi:hypothetical protein